jgi:hypothetical protein
MAPAFMHSTADWSSVHSVIVAAAPASTAPTVKGGAAGSPDLELEWWRTTDDRGGLRTNDSE